MSAITICNGALLHTPHFLLLECFVRRVQVFTSFIAALKRERELWLRYRVGPPGLLAGWTGYFGSWQCSGARGTGLPHCQLPWSCHPVPESRMPWLRGAQWGTDVPRFLAGYRGWARGGTGGGRWSSPIHLPPPMCPSAAASAAPNVPWQRAAHCAECRHFHLPERIDFLHANNSCVAADTWPCLRI